MVEQCHETEMLMAAVSQARVVATRPRAVVQGILHPNVAV